MTIPAALTTTMLAWSMLSFPKSYIAAGTVDRTMSQVRTFLPCMYAVAFCNLEAWQY